LEVEMTQNSWLPSAELHHSQILTARVVSLVSRGTATVVTDAGEEHCDCPVLRNSESRPLQLVPGDRVLICRTDGSDALVVIVGRFGSTLTAETPGGDAPDELVIEAKHSLTLRVGAGSVTIREDGKILIKGKDLVSHAQRLNRIKGGAVQIN